jgi:hypothetical protein
MDNTDPQVTQSVPPLVNQNTKKPLKSNRRILIGVALIFLVVIIMFGVVIFFRSKTVIQSKAIPSPSATPEQKPNLSSKMTLSLVTTTSVKGVLSVSNLSNFPANNLSLTFFVRGQTVDQPVTLNGKLYHKLTPGQLFYTVKQTIPHLDANGSTDIPFTASIVSGTLSGEDQAESLITTAKEESLTTATAKLDSVQNVSK